MNREQQIERMVTRLRDEAARQSTDPALRREAAELLAEIAKEKPPADDAVAILNHMIANPSDCDFLGPTDPETGVRECNRRGGDCLCAERMEALEDALERISRGKT
jgi:hypothetical protein